MIRPPGAEEPIVEFTLLEPDGPLAPDAAAGDADVLDLLYTLDADDADGWATLAEALRLAVAADAAGIVYRIDPMLREQAGDLLAPHRCHAIEAMPVHPDIVAWHQSTPAGVELIAPVGGCAINAFLWLRVADAAALPTDLRLLRMVRAFATSLWRQHRHDWQAALLLRERDHCARNDLQLLIAMLEQHARLAQESEVRAALEDSVTQITALSRARTVREGRLDDALREYCEAIAGPLDRRGVALALAVDGHDGWLQPAQVRLVVIAVNELVTNAAKHGFPAGARHGAIRVDVALSPDHCRVSVADDGRPMPRASRPDDPDHGVGMVRRLLALAGATLTLPDGDAGFMIDISAPPQPQG